MSQNRKLSLNGLLEKPVVKNIIAPVIRGAVRTLPGGNAIIDGAANIKKEFTKEKEKNPHDYKAIIIEIVGVAVVIYAFSQKIITVDQVLQLIGFGE